MASRRRRSGKLATKLVLVCSVTAVVATGLTVVAVSQTLSSAIASQHSDIVTRGWLLGGILVVVSGCVVGLAAYLQGAAIGSRLTDLGLGLAKIGRGSAEVRVRFSGDDEIGKLGRALQYLSSDLTAMAREAEEGGAVGANMDPMVRELRDRTLPEEFPEVEGFELDGAVSPGTRGGLDYFGCVVQDDGAVMFIVSAEGTGPVAVLAARMARDELVRALGAEATPRKALAHTNRVLYKQLPKGSCARACVLQLAGDGIKLYQAGYPAPLLFCRAGEVDEINGEGLARGLDEGPVFDKGLRPVSEVVSQGVRVVLANDAALRIGEFVDLVAEHSPKHTAPFMNMVLGALERDAGEGGLREDVVLLTAKRW